MPTPERRVVGWDIGGAHVKACLMQRGEVLDVAQWACPLWQGLEHLDRVLDAAHERWPSLAAAHHAVTMTGEMVDLFEHREDGVRRIAERLAARLGAAEPPQFFAGDAGWCGAGDVARDWAAIASANWLATARHAARYTAQHSAQHPARHTVRQTAHPTDRQTAHPADPHTAHLAERPTTARANAAAGEGVLIDIGSTTTDLIAFRAGRVLATSRTDAQRLASGELVYHGVVRTPLCAVAPRIAWRGETLNVMNEFFATSADVYRATGELDPAHDLHPAADNAGKDAPATHRRLARMIGLDARDASPGEWLQLAHAWRAAQVAELAGQLQRVMEAHGLDAGATFVSAGCGDFLVADVVAQAVGPAAAERCIAYGTQVARVAHGAPPALARWAQVCAPSVAVAALFGEERL
jgi:(4-(4-[2-(gamma-L-glutamylamino)ethyl]phenoxymethyl)furan-2-yl)methanamine synthase